MPYAEDGASIWSALKCTPVDPDPVGPGDVCTAVGGGVSGVDNCEKSSMCWDVDPDTNEGVCISFCEGTNADATCEPGFQCYLGRVLSLCLPTCDPLLQDCPDGDLCAHSGDFFSCQLDYSGDEGQYGDPCESANACDPGLYCISAEYVPDCQGAGCCTPWCDTSKPLTCPGATQECIPWYEEGMEPPGYEDVGICGIPQ